LLLRASHRPRVDQSAFRTGELATSITRVDKTGSVRPLRMHDLRISRLA
jgi:hypothetical protein